MKSALEVSQQATLIANALSDAIPVFPKKLLKQDVLFHKHQLPQSQLQALLILKNGELTIGEISGRLGIAKPNVSPVVDELEESGLVKREKDERDKRIVRVLLTEKGTKKIESIIETLQEEAKAWLVKLPQRERNAMAKSLTALIELMNELE